MEYNWEDLIGKAINGDKFAMDDLYRGAERDVYIVVKSLIKDDSIAMDIVQEAMLKGLTSLNSLQVPDKFVPWMKRIARNKALDHLRKGEREVSFTTLEEEEGFAREFEDVSLENIPEYSLERKEATRLLNEATKGLKQEEYAIFTMFELENYKLQEIADILGMNINTVKTKKTAATKKIKKAIEKMISREDLPLYGVAPMPVMAWLIGCAATPEGGGTVLFPGIMGSVTAGAVAGQAVGAGVAAVAGAGVAAAAGAGVTGSVTTGGILTALGIKIGIAVSAVAVVTVGVITTIAITEHRSNGKINIFVEEAESESSFTEGSSLQEESSDESTQADAESESVEEKTESLMEEETSEETSTEEELQEQEEYPSFANYQISRIDRSEEQKERALAKMPTLSATVSVYYDYPVFEGEDERVISINKRVKEEAETAMNLDEMYESTTVDIWEINNIYQNGKYLTFAGETAHQGGYGGNTVITDGEFAEDQLDNRNRRYKYTKTYNIETGEPVSYQELLGTASEDEIKEIIKAGFDEANEGAEDWNAPFSDQEYLRDADNIQELSRPEKEYVIDAIERYFSEEYNTPQLDVEENGDIVCNVWVDASYGLSVIFRAKVGNIDDLKEIETVDEKKEEQSEEYASVKWSVERFVGLEDYNNYYDLVILEGNDEATQKINQFLETEKNECINNEDYDYWVEGYINSGNTNALKYFSNCVEYVEAWQHEKYFSIRCNYNWYAGGSGRHAEYHKNYNFDLTTGEVVQLEEIMNMSHDKAWGIVYEKEVEKTGNPDLFYDDWNDFYLDKNGDIWVYNDTVEEPFNVGNISEY